MDHLPVFLDIKGQQVLVVGGGCGAAARKARLLVKAGACVTVVCPYSTPDSELLSMAAGGAVELHLRAFVPDDVKGRAVVISAIGSVQGAECDDVVVSNVAKNVGVPVNVVDGPGLSTFIMPAIVERDAVTVAISSGGTAPVLARSLRAKIERMLPANLGRLARFADSFRAAVQATHREPVARRRFWERFFDGPVAEAVLNGDERWARERMLEAVNRPQEIQSSDGIVYLVGAGPGDSDLLTMRALRLLEQADVIVHDRLVAPEVLDYARRDAERVYVGKAKGAHARTQDQINALLVELAASGQRVVRLKGGDPFVFGRGGEEREYLIRHGMRVEVVPGITAASGCAAATGIPLTHRECAQSAVLVTGHGKDGEPDLDWNALANQKQTIAVYMGASMAGSISQRLIRHGMDPATPAAVIANGTRPDQRIETGALHQLETLTARCSDAPLLLVVGDVVRHADAWTGSQTGQAVAG